MSKQALGLCIFNIYISIFQFGQQHSGIAVYCFLVTKQSEIDELDKSHLHRVDELNSVF